jgi:hypothetical protein
MKVEIDPAASVVGLCMFGVDRGNT